MCVLAMQRVIHTACVWLCVYGGDVFVLVFMERLLFRKNLQLNFSKNQLERNLSNPFKLQAKGKSSRLPAEGFHWLVYHGRAPEM